MAKSVCLYCQNPVKPGEPSIQVIGSAGSSSGVNRRKYTVHSSCRLAHDTEATERYRRRKEESSATEPN